MLVENTARRLYKVPKESQLLARLGGEWHAPSPSDFLLPTPNRNSSSTTLRSLAARVPPGGPRIDPFPDIPPDAPSWNGRVTLTPKTAGWDYDEVTNALTESCREGRTTNIYCNALVSNKDREDGKQLGAASAVLYHEGREHGHVETVFGEAITEADALTRALSPGLDALILLLTDRPAQHHVLAVFLIPSGPALNKTLDTSPHEEQATALDHIERLGELLTTFPNVQVRLQWLPRKVPFIGFRRARQLAFEAIRVADPREFHEPPSIKKLEETTKRAVISIWEGRYYVNPRTSFAYKTAIQGPPDGKAHHTFNVKRTPVEERENPELNDPVRDDAAATVKFSRLTYATVLRYITAHAFTGEYTQRFYPPHTQEQIACPCGKPLQTVEHVLTECPLYAAARRRHLTANGRPRTLPQLFANSKRVQDVLRFVEETGACIKPRERWELG
jgi:hypothetical protein